jgi:hypothetical protein
MPPPCSTVAAPPAIWKSSKVTVVPARIVKTGVPELPLTSGGPAVPTPEIVRLRSMVTLSVGLPTSWIVWQLASFTADWMEGSVALGTSQTPASGACGPLVVPCVAKADDAPADTIVAATGTARARYDILRFNSPPLVSSRRSFEPATGDPEAQCDCCDQRAQTDASAVAGPYRFDDPDGRVGLGGLPRRRRRCRAPGQLTYRDQPLARADDALICLTVRSTRDDVSLDAGPTERRSR